MDSIQRFVRCKGEYRNYFANGREWWNTCVCMLSESISCLVVSNSLWPRGLLPSRLLCPGNSPGKNAGVGGLFLLQFSWSRDWTWVSCIVGRFLTVWATRQEFLPGEFPGQRSLAGYSPWCCRVGHDWETFTFSFQWLIICFFFFSIYFRL